MTDSLIQKYIQARIPTNAPVANTEATGRPVIHPVYSPKTGVKPYTPSGHLVKENIIQAAISNVKQYGEGAKYLYDALRGKGTDYTVGRTNDITTRLGSLGIAGIIAAGAGSPLKKGMEFVGLASWFGAMALWPSIVGAPIKFFKGVDINQQYVDSYGRQKKFFEDSQYITWDLMSDEQLSKAGDKLGIPKDINNRKDAIKDKMKQVAIQGNTIAMITAGFATPFISGFVCDKFGGLYKKAGEALNIHFATKTVGGAISESTALDNILSSNKLMTAEAKAALKEIFSKKLDNVEIKNSVLEQVEAIIPSHDAVVEINDALKQRIKEASGLEDSVVEEILKAAKEKCGTAPIDKQNFGIHIANKTGVACKKTLPKAANNLKAQKAREAQISTIIDKVGQLFEESKLTVLSAEAKNKLRALYSVADTYVPRSAAITKYMKTTLMNIEGSSTANTWGQITPEFVKALGIKGEDLRKLADQTTSPEVKEGIITKALENIAGDKDKLEKATARIAKAAKKAYEKEDKQVAYILGQIKQAYADIIQTADKQVSPAFAKALENDMAVKASMAINKSINTKVSFLRPLKVLDLFARYAADKENPAFQMLKQMLFGPMNTDKFVNKLDSLKFNASMFDPSELDPKKLGLVDPNELDPKKLVLVDREHDFIMFKAFMNKLFAPVEVQGEHKDVIAVLNEAQEVVKSMMMSLSCETRPDMNISEVEAEKVKEIFQKFKIIGEEYAGRYIFIDKPNHKYFSYAEHCTEVAGKGFQGLIEMGAKELYGYNKWLKRAGIPALALLGVTGVLVSQVGKTNKFNTDVYELKGGKKNDR